MAELPKQKNKIPAQFSVDKNTLLRSVKDNPKDRIDIEIGDSKQPDFKPQFKVSRWDNEVNFSLRAQEHPEATVDIEGDVVKYITPDYEVHQYEKSEAGEDGGFEFEWVLPSKPISNILTATIQTKELNFFFQPPLTAEEIAEGASRPDNVVGSYAAYHKTKGKMNRADGMEYKTGKALHIYRPEAIDANGDRTWCELHIDVDTGVLQVSVPEKFLVNATYPVVVDPTFGYTSVGASNLATATDYVWGSFFTAPEAGTLTNLSFYQVTSTFDDGARRLLVHLDSSDALVDYTDSSSGGNTDAWTDYVVILGAAITNTDYWLTHWGAEIAMSYDTVASAGGRAALTYSTSVANIPDPLPAMTTRNERHSIYATYTTAGSASSSPSTSVSASPSASPSTSPSSSPSTSPSSSPSATPSPSSSPSPSPSTSPSSSPSTSASASPSATPSPSSSSSTSPSSSPSSSPSVGGSSPSSSPSTSPSSSPSATPSPSSSPSTSPSASPSSSPSATPSPSSSPSTSPSTSPSSSPSATPSPSSSPSPSPSSSPSASPSPSPSSSPSSSPSGGATSWNRFNGTTWDNIPGKYWNGSAWVDIG